MTTPHQLIHQGKVKEAIIALKETIKADTANPKLRMFYFQLLAITGDWKRSLEQLETAASMDPAQLPVKYAITPLLLGEATRADVFAGRKTPLIMGEPDGWMGLLLQSLVLLNAGKTAEAVALQAEALAKAPAKGGAIDGRPFEWLADADSRLGPVIEAYIDEKYYWVPMMHIKTLAIEKPSDLRDLAWLPAVFTWTNGGVIKGFIPTRYPGTENSDDNNALLAKTANWTELAPNYSTGTGLRFFMTGEADHAITQTTLISFA
jgi:type VI secretion system protein ImpE